MHTKIPQKVSLLLTFFEGFGAHVLFKNASVYAGCRGFSGPTTYGSFAQLKATFASVDKVGERFVFKIGGNKYRLIAAIAFQAKLVWVKAVLTHEQYDQGDWK